MGKVLFGYLIRTRGIGVRYEVFPQEEVEQYSSLEDLERELGEHCLWYAPLGQIQARSSGKRARFRMPLAKVPGPCGVTKRIGRLHPFYGKPEDQVVVYDAICDALYQFLERIPPTKAPNGETILTFKDCTLSSGQMDTLLAELGVSHRATVKVDVSVNTCSISADGDVVEDDLGFPIPLVVEITGDADASIDVKVVTCLQLRSHS